MKYITVCKCRLCGKEFYVDDDWATELEAAANIIESASGQTPFEIHYCDNGDVGFGDVLGARKVEE